MRYQTQPQIPGWAWIVGYLIAIGALLQASSSPSTPNYEDNREPGACQAAATVWSDC